MIYAQAWFIPLAVTHRNPRHLGCLERHRSCHPLSLESDKGPRLGGQSANRGDVPFGHHDPSHPRVVPASITDVRKHDGRTDFLDADLARLGTGERVDVRLGSRIESDALCASDTVGWHVSN